MPADEQKREGCGLQTVNTTTAHITLAPLSSTFCSIVEMDPTLGTVSVAKADADESEPPKIFTLDAVYDWT